MNNDVVGGNVTPRLIDPGFLAVLKALDPSVCDRVQRLGETYLGLIALGWSQGDIEKAAGMGYNFMPHLRMPEHRWNCKYGSDARPFYDWVRHYYRRDKAEKLGMSLDEYIELWINLRTKPWQINVGRMPWVGDLMAHYMRARRFGLEDGEIRYNFFGHLDRARSYLWLRREFDSSSVRKLIVAGKEKRGRLHEKYAIEASRRGASFEAIVDSVRAGTLHELALNLRKAQRAQKE